MDYTVVLSWEELLLVREQLDLAIENAQDFEDPEREAELQGVRDKLNAATT